MEIPTQTALSALQIQILQHLQNSDYAVPHREIPNGVEHTYSIGEIHVATTKMWLMGYLNEDHQFYTITVRGENALKSALETVEIGAQN